MKNYVCYHDKEHLTVSARKKLCQEREFISRNNLRVSSLQNIKYYQLYGGPNWFAWSATLHCFEIKIRVIDRALQQKKAAAEFKKLPTKIRQVHKLRRRWLSRGASECCAAHRVTIHFVSSKTDFRHSGLIFSDLSDFKPR